MLFFVQRSILKHNKTNKHLLLILAKLGQEKVRNAFSCDADDFMN